MQPQPSCLQFPNNSTIFLTLGMLLHLAVLFHWIDNAVYVALQYEDLAINHYAIQLPIRYHLHYTEVSFPPRWSSGSQLWCLDRDNPCNQREGIESTGSYSVFY